MMLIILCCLEFGEFIIYAGMQPLENSSTLSPSTTISSQFCLNGTRINLATSCSVSIAQQSQDTGYKFLNRPCEIVENQVVKCFTITYKDTMIYVEDRITIEALVRNFQNQQSIQSKNNESWIPYPKKRSKNKKVVLFQRSTLTKVNDDQRIDKKNIVKNFVKAFFKYLKEGRLGHQLPQYVIETVSKLIKAKKFNNRMITSLIKKRIVRLYFKKFLVLEALNWIQNSKIKVKDIYKEALQIYEKLCSDEDKKQQQSIKSPPDQRGSNSSSLDFRELQNYDLQQIIRGFK